MNLQELKNRLDILLDQGVIVNHAYTVTMSAYKQVLDLLNAENVEQGEMLFTHLPMALTRIINGETVEGPEDEMMKEVESSSNYPKARQLLESIEKNWGDALPHEEENFLKLHFTNVFNINEGVE